MKLTHLTEPELLALLTSLPDSAHADKKRVRDRLYYLKNADKIKARSKTYHHENREAVLEQMRIRTGRRDRQAEKQRLLEYRRAHPEVVRAHKANSDAREYGLEERITKEEVLQVYSNHNGQCHYCGKLLGQEYSIDHALPFCRGGANTVSNLRLSCLTCNLRKRHRTEQEYLAVLAATP